MIRGIFKIVLIGILTISFSACENKYEKKEVKFTPKLAMPESGKLREMGLIGLWYDAKHDPIPATKIGYAYSEELKDYEKAIEWYKYSDSMIPLGENSYFACYAYQQLKQYDEAIKWCKNAVDLNWDEAIFRTGKILELKKEFISAVGYYKKSFDKTKDGVSANNLGLIYSLELNNNNEAEMWFKKSIEEKYPLAYKNIAIFYHKNLKDNIKASAYAIAVINTKYTKSSVMELLQKDWKIPNNIIKQGYELQLNSKEFPIKYEGELFE